MTDILQGRLTRWAAAFLFVFALILTLSPALRERTWDVEYRWAHWIGFALWAAVFAILDRVTAQYLPDRDPYLLPTAGLLCGWGLLTIWRLDTSFGLRQTAWLTLCGLAAALTIGRTPDVGALRRYKYVLLAGGLALTALTLIFGTNPSGIGPRLWLGCCGLFFQPSEPLKLLLVLYLAAYLADRTSIQISSYALVLPTLLMVALALVILFVQKDLGTATIFILLYTTILYVATNRWQVLILAVLGLVTALTLGFATIDVVQNRVLSWLNPWADPSGRSYQIVQSLLAIANGGVLGRGPGVGNPGLVPVAISDFAFAAVAEETGLIGTTALISLLALILARGLVTALHATDRFRRLLATGVTSYLGLQSLLIMGGNLRLVPLTGVTLPFLSYGGSSLLTSVIAILLLLLISSERDTEPAQLRIARPYALLAAVLGAGFATVATSTAWWSVVRGPDLLLRTDNARRAIADRYVPRGRLLDRNNAAINVTEGVSGNFQRAYLHPSLASVIGYTHPAFGQAGLEASLDEYLRGLQGNPFSLIVWESLVFGTPPPGIDVRLSLDLKLQARADELLGGHPGAIILMNAESGEILVMGSHPTFDPLALDSEAAVLSESPEAPFLNRATQGAYLAGTSLIPFARAEFGDREPSEPQLISLYGQLGFYVQPELRAPVGTPPTKGSHEFLRISPLQAALATSTLSNHGLMAAPQIAMAVNTSQEGWVILPPLGQPSRVFEAQAADQAAVFYATNKVSYWQHMGQATQNESVVTWFLTGTLPDWQGPPLICVVALEENNTFLAEYIGREVMAEAQAP